MDREMTQEELAIRTGFSPKHISEVVNGKKGISPSFAKSLEYVLGMPTSFWINLQGIYDEEIIAYKEQKEIDENEVEIVKSLKEVIKYANELEIIKKTNSMVGQIIELRNICNVNNLTYIRNLFNGKVAFRKSSVIETNIYVLYVWIRLCEIIAEKNNVENCEEIFKEILIAQPQNSIALRGLGCVMQAKGNSRQAIKYYKKALKYSENKEIEYTLLGTIYYNEDNLEKAMENYNMAIEVNDNYDLAYEGRNQSMLEYKLKIIDLQDNLIKQNLF